MLNVKNEKLKRIADSKRHTACRVLKVLQCLVQITQKEMKEVGYKENYRYFRRYTVKREAPDHEGASNTQIYPIQNPHRNWKNAKDNTCFGVTLARWHRRQFTIFRPDCITSRPETKNGASSDNLQCFISHGELFHSSIQFSSLSFLLLELKPQ